jgi:hypothetical protein
MWRSFFINKNNALPDTNVLSSGVERILYELAIFVAKKIL